MVTFAKQPQFQSLFLSSVLLFGGMFLLSIQTEKPATRVKGATDIRLSLPVQSDAQLEVTSPSGVPADTSLLLQGVHNVQQQQSDVGTASNTASQLLQPNSGRSDFGDSATVQ